MQQPMAALGPEAQDAAAGAVVVKVYVNDKAVDLIDKVVADSFINLVNSTDRR